MRFLRAFAGISLVSGAVVAGIACGSTTKNDTFPGDDGGGGGDDSGSGGGSCPICVTGADCTNPGANCVVLGVDSFCVQACADDGSCASGASCMSTTTFDGRSLQACVPSSDCSSGGGNTDSGGGPPVDSGVPYDGGGGQVTGTVGANGGTLSRLLFAVVGDTRPATYDDVAGYPTAIITKIFQDVEAFNPKPAFVIGTGDYQFASSGSSSTAGQQLDLYEHARAGYSNVHFPAMGNHECTGSTTSNCGSGNTNGTTANYTAFMSKLLGPIQKTLPYYVINVNAVDNSWTSKFVFIAANAWDSTQSSWLSTTMAKATTYTFVIRHEPPDASPAAPGQAPSEAIIAQHPYTLLIVGHSHTYGHYATPYPREVIVGNGGAPLSVSNKNYGFAVMSQRADGAIVGDMIDYMSGLADSRFHFAVKPDGTLTN
jgi:hypothetical protein